MPMTVKITGAGGVQLGSGIARLFAAAPDIALKYLESAARDTAPRVRARGQKYAKTRYTYGSFGKISSAMMGKAFAKQGVGFDLKSHLAGKRFAVIGKFYGHVGLPLAAFKGNANQARVSWKKVPNSARTPRGGIKAQILKSGGMGTYIVPKGRPIFWKRDSKGAHLAAEGFNKLIGPSPIQAIQKKENSRAIEQFAYETYAKRVAHQADRMIAKMLGMK